jgi:hypothetical protein
MKKQLMIAPFVVAAITLLSTAAAQSTKFVKDWETPLIHEKKRASSVSNSQSRDSRGIR